MFPTKENAQRSLERMEGFWHREIIDRFCLGIECPSGIGWTVPPPASLEQKWLDAGYRLRRFKDEMRTTLHMGELFPQFMPDLGPGFISTFVGADFELRERTIWFGKNRTIPDITDRKPLSIDRESPLWKKLFELFDLFYPEAKGDYLVNLTDLSGSLDIAAALLGTEEMLCAMMTEPEALEVLLEEIDAVWIETFREQMKYTRKYQEYCSGWLPVFKKEGWFPLQSDASVMISEKQFERFVLPSVRRVTEAIGGESIWHLDGPGEIRFVDMLLDVPGICGIQWVPYFEPDGWYDHLNPEYIPMYRKVQKKKKLLVFPPVNPKRIEELFRYIEPEGVYLATRAENVGEAREILRLAESVTRGCKKARR